MAFGWVAAPDAAAAGADSGVDGVGEGRRDGLLATRAYQAIAHHISSTRSDGREILRRKQLFS
jgi:hypothetical protein